MAGQRRDLPRTVEQNGHTFTVERGTKPQVDCTCTGDQIPEHRPVRRQTALLVVTTWICVHCSGEVFAEWSLRNVNQEGEAMTQNAAACVNLLHDHDPHGDGEDAVCRDCCLPLHYDLKIEDYQHDNTEAPDCFLTQRSEHASPCQVAPDAPACAYCGVAGHVDGSCLLPEHLGGGAGPRSAHHKKKEH